LIEDGTRGEPVVAFVAADGIGHALWVVDDPAAAKRLEASFREVPGSYIADGHHRAAAYARVALIRREAAAGGADERPFDRFLAVHFPASRLRILAYNRLVRDLSGLDGPRLLKRLDAAGFDVVAPWPAKSPRGAASFGMYVDGAWRLLIARPDKTPESDPVNRLDVAVLQDRVLAPILGVGDPRTDGRITFSGGIRGVAELERRVDSGEHAIAFAMHPTSMEEVMHVADAGGVMPPKSTWFEPKLRSGMVVHVFDEA
jgi:uncharacterized protein (DUF1015 family)